MPKKERIHHLPGFAIKKVSEINPLVIEVNYRRRARCVDCNSTRLRKKDSFLREVRHVSIGLRQSVLRCFKAYKFQCYGCKRYFNQRFPGILRYQRASEPLRQQVFYQHTQGMSQKDLSTHLKLGKATIERWYHQGYWREHQLLKSKACPQVLGIDEHFFSQRRGFTTTLCDLCKHTVFDVIKGRSGQDIEAYLQALPGKDKVKVICMDLSSTYCKLVRRYFPNAKIVADRFHVIRLINQMCLQTYQSIDPTMKYNRGLLGALRTNHERLKPKQQHKRNDYFKQQPAIEAIYQFKQQLHQLLLEKHCQARKCKRLLPVFLDFIKQLKQQPLQPLQTLGKTLVSMAGRNSQNVALYQV